MLQALQFVLSVITSSVNWLLSWQYLGVPFLYYLMGIVIIGVVLRFVF